MLSYVISCHVVSSCRHVVSCHVMSCHVMSCYAMLCYAMLCYAMCYVFSKDLNLASVSEVSLIFCARLFYMLTSRHIASHDYSSCWRSYQKVTILYI